MKQTGIVLILFFAVNVCAQPYKNASFHVEERIGDLMGRMTTEDKVLLLHPNFFSTKPNERLGIPAIKFIDGSYGLRCGRSTAFSTPVNYAATWNPELINRAGIAIAEEVRAKGRNMLLGPVILMHRIPQAGRNAESYSEDPFLAGTVATSYIKGIQSLQVPATADFIGAKTTEYHGHFYDVRVSERALHEIYLPAFRMAVEEAGVWGIMTPYNRLNGVRASDNHYLLWEILKKKWGHRGLVVTDWMGVQNFQASVYAGLDLDMWGGRKYTIENLTKVYETAANDPRDRYGMRLHAERLDESVRRILRVMFSNGLFENPVFEARFDTSAHSQIALEIGRESITLLKNEGDLLPLDPGKTRSVAVIGPNADVTRHSIRWASRVLPYTTVSPLEGITAAAGEKIRIRYSQGCAIDDLGKFLTSEEVSTRDGRPGFLVEWFDNDTFSGEPVSREVENSVGYFWVNHPLDPSREARDSQGEFSVRATGVWTPQRSGYYRVYTTTADVDVDPADGKEVDGAQGARQLTKQVDGREYRYYEKGRSYQVKAEYVHSRSVNFQLRYSYFEEDGQTRAVEAARKSDVAILFLGFSETVEAENKDREPDLPENQIRLIRAVAEVNPNLVVLLNSGSGVSVEPWGKLARSILWAGYPGQEGGTAVADILFGKVSPSGKLPFTMMNRWKDSPVYGHYPQGEDEMLHYVEDIYVGYRWFDRFDTPEAAFSFGHGLSYTTFQYDGLTIQPGKTNTGEVTASLKVRNTGSVAGAEVVQLYIGDTHVGVDRPVRELKGYRKVFLEPGEEEQVSFPVELRDLMYYDPVSRGWKAEPGQFTIYAGSSSTDIRQTGTFTLTDNYME